MSQNRPRQAELVLIKAAQVMPFVDTISRRGGDIAGFAERAGMPLDAVLEGQGLIGERSAWRFIGFAAQALDLDHLGHVTAQEHPVHSTGDLGGMRVRMASTLGRLLRFFVEDVTFENNGAQYALLPEGNTVVFRRNVMFPDCVGRWQTEQYMVTVLMQIIALCAGPDARPLQIRLASNDRPLPVPADWDGIDIRWGNTWTDIVLDADLLNTPLDAGLAKLNQYHARNADTPVSIDDIDFIVDRLIWSGQARLDCVARELGVSGSTVKRRLRQSGRRFSQIVGARRHYWAEYMLSETDTPISHTASALGYQHLSNFSRAFKVKTGVSPRVFRAQLKANSTPRS